MIPFETVVPERAGEGTLRIQTRNDHSMLPAGEYSFEELYCEMDGCDCRRAVIVARKAGSSEGLAVINLGWERRRFYKRNLAQVVSDAEIDALLEGALDPINSQSPLAPALLKLLQEHIRQHPEYLLGLGQRYKLFKQTYEQVTSGKPRIRRANPVEMEDRELVGLLSEFPFVLDLDVIRALISEAWKRGQRLASNYVEILESMSVENGKGNGKETERFPYYALYLLAGLKVESARDAIVNFLCHPSEKHPSIHLEALYADGGMLLASACGSDSRLLVDLVLDPMARIEIRVSALRGLVVQCAWNRRSMGGFIEDIRTLYRELPRPCPKFLLDCLVEASVWSGSKEFLPLVDEAYLSGLFQGVEKSHEEARSLIESGGARDESPIEVSPINPIVDCEFLHRAYCADPEEPEEGFDQETEGDWDASDVGGDSPAKVNPVGRNDPCPCGSGKKFKKCCG